MTAGASPRRILTAGAIAPVAPAKSAPMHTDCVGIDRRKADRVDLDDKKSEWEMKTITSAIKNYFRCVCLSVMTVVNVHVHSIGLFRFFSVD